MQVLDSTRLDRRAGRPGRRLWATCLLCAAKLIMYGPAKSHTHRLLYAQCRQRDGRAVSVGVRLMPKGPGHVMTRTRHSRPLTPTECPDPPSLERPPPLVLAGSTRWRSTPTAACGPGAKVTRCLVAPRPRAGVDQNFHHARGWATLQGPLAPQAGRWAARPRIRPGCPVAPTRSQS